MGTSIVASTNTDDAERHNKGTQFLIFMRHLCRASQVKNFDETLDLFQRMARMKPVPFVKDFTLLLGVIVRLRHYTTAISLVKHMYFALGIEPDTITLNIVINCLCRLKLISFGFSVLGTMFKLGLEPTVETLKGNKNEPGSSSNVSTTRREGGTTVESRVGSTNSKGSRNRGMKNLPYPEYIRRREEER
ncbi:hypothetical protein VIGAN_01161100 [Vigna angularis var. angularis]|uniref:Pentacotripeptide-repeat region of PRORP domain-containing protein n=1 Tax=Vigna angularis var. angularis TaxID=157739 RepID=A0A0S3R0H5_PHAAN|nr:hypothetical protein VIGAN_01161100 [Vigna angularis var. angularis]